MQGRSIDIFEDLRAKLQAAGQAIAKQQLGEITVAFREVDSCAHTILDYSLPWYEKRIAALQEAVTDPRGTTLRELEESLQSLLAPNRSFGNVYDSVKLALEEAYRALGSQGYVFVHILIDWLRSLRYRDERVRMVVDAGARENLERDAARRGWAIAKAGSAELEASRAAAQELFGEAEALRLFPRLAESTAQEQTS